MIWDLFPAMASAHLAANAAALGLVAARRPKMATIPVAVGAALLAAFLAGIWLDMGRPPLRTYGETRLWYALGVAGLSLLLHGRTRQTWTLFYGASMAALFVGITWAVPESRSRELMPALRSPWFVPHVTVYLLAYAAATATSIAAFLDLRRPVPGGRNLDALLAATVVLLSCGLLFGALWAKEAWGSCWTWDPKETWAFLTWAGYTGVLHWRRSRPAQAAAGAWCLVALWGVLLLAWFAVGYLPGGANSVHVYAN